MDYSKLTLGELLSSDNETIKRNAISILKTFQKYEINWKKGNNELSDNDRKLQKNRLKPLS